MPNEPGHAIAARMDLDPVSQLPNGAIDSKVKIIPTLKVTVSDTKVNMALQPT